MQVAHVHDLRDRNALGHQLLLHRGNLARVALANECRQPPLDLGRRLALVKVPDDFLQRTDAVRPVVDEFAHDQSPRPGCASGPQHLPAEDIVASRGPGRHDSAPGPGILLA